MATQARPAPIETGDEPSSEAQAPPDTSLLLMDDDTADERLSLLVYGPPGVGKTFLGGTAADDPRSSPVLFLDLENGSLTVRWRARSQALRIMTPDDVGGDLLSVAEACKRGKAIYKPTGEPFKTVVIDSLTDQSWEVQQQLIRQGGRDRNAPKDALAWGEWNSYSNKLRELIRAFRDAKVHVIATALERETRDDGFLSPTVVGAQMSQNLPAFFDTVARLSMRQVVGPDGKSTIDQRQLLMSAGSKYTAKDRTDPLGLLPKVIVDPTMAKLLDRMEEGIRLAVEKGKGGK